MKKKSVSKIFKAPIRPMKFDQTEMLLLLFVVISLLVFVGWQTGAFHLSGQSSVLGASAGR